MQVAREFIGPDVVFNFQTRDAFCYQDGTIEVTIVGNIDTVSIEEYQNRANNPENDILQIMHDFENHCGRMQTIVTQNPEKLALINNNLINSWFNEINRNISLRLNPVNFVKVLVIVPDVSIEVLEFIEFTMESKLDIKFESESEFKVVIFDPLNEHQGIHEIYDPYNLIFDDEEIEFWVQLAQEHGFI